MGSGFLFLKTILETRQMILKTGTKSECVREMLLLESLHGKHFWVFSNDDRANTYSLEASAEYTAKMAQDFIKNYKLHRFVDDRIREYIAAGLEGEAALHKFRKALARHIDVPLAAIEKSFAEAIFNNRKNRTNQGAKP
jgi:hypothetical protein